MTSRDGEGLRNPAAPSEDLGDLLLRHAGRSFAPPQAASATVWRGVESALAAGSLAPAPLTPSVPSGTSGVAGTSGTAAAMAPRTIALGLSWKAAVGLLAMGLVGVGVMAAWPRASHVEQPRMPEVLAPPEATAVASPSSSQRDVPLATSAPLAEPLAEGPVSPVVPHASRAPGAASPPPPEVTSPATEASMLLEARQAIRAGDQARALRLLSAVSPRGPLAEEREILTIEAFAGAPHSAPRAKKMAAQFLERHPQSPYRGRAEAVLAR